MLGSERDRAHALHRENAHVSREATMAQKEVLSLEAKMFHAGKEVCVLLMMPRARHLSSSYFLDSVWTKEIWDRPMATAGLLELAF